MVTTVKGILLILFLYLGLVWTGSWYLYRDRENAADAVIRNGLLYTMVGLAVLLVLLLGSWLLGYMKVFRARAAARPKPAPAASKPQAAHEDDMALRTLLSEASARLLASPAFAKNVSNPQFALSGMPLYLVVGLEGSGKTGTLANSGLNPELLAGQPRMEKSAPASTNIANIWFAGEALFVEVGGRHFAGDSRRWSELLAVLAAKPKISLWQRLWKGDLPGLDLRGVIHCCDLKFFLTKPGPEQIERQSQLVQERLRAIIKAFGRRLPVFTIFTKSDQIPYFRDFFGRFSERESDQVLGCTLRFAEESAGTDQSEGKRLTRAFNNLYTALTERRISVLFHEPASGRKSRIFEFPREFNKLRQSLVDFLVQTFRPSPLQPTPLNRGFYFSGTREVEALPPSPDSSSKGFETTSLPFHQAMDATIVFHGDAAELMKGGSDAELNLTRVRRGGLQTRWAFLNALFQDVICRDRSSDTLEPTVVESGIGKPRTIALATALGFSIFLGLMWGISWYRNASLVGAVKQAAMTNPAVHTLPGVLPGLPEFESLDALRERLGELQDLEASSGFRNLWHLTMRFGLYSVGDLRAPVRKAYFRRLETSLLDLSHAKLTSFLKEVGEPSSPAPDGQIVSDRLKALVMATSPATCTVEPSVVSAEFSAMSQAAGLLPTDPRYPLALKQIDFFSRELSSGRVTLSGMQSDPGAQEHALRYVARSRNVEQYFKDLIANLEHDLGTHAELTSLVENYESVLTGPSRVSIAFTPAGWTEFKTRLDSGKIGSPADPCISSLLAARAQPGGDASPVNMNEEEKRRIGSLYAARYLQVWRDFLSQFHVSKFGLADAPKRLQILSANDSPLLGLFEFVADNTTFGRLPFDQKEKEKEGLVGAAVQKIKGALASVEVQPATLSEVEDAFQPVRSVVPPHSKFWIVEKNKPYMNALSALADAMDEIARNPGGGDANAAAARNQKASDAAMEALKLASAFRIDFSAGSSRVDDKVIDLLREPIDLARQLLQEKSGILAGNFEGKREQMCRRLDPILRKFPFTPTNHAESLTLKEFADWFAPNMGIWQEEKVFADLVILGDGKSWTQNLSAQEVRPHRSLLAFLNKAQDITNAFFAEGRKTAGLRYTLRPGQGNVAPLLEFRIDGVRKLWEPSNLRQWDFDWPAKQDNEQGAVGSTGAQNNLVPFTSGDGPWGVFRMFGQAQQHSGKFHTWTRTAAGSPMPASVQLEVVEPSAAIAVFDPAFFSEFRCATNAVQK